MGFTRLRAIRDFESQHSPKNFSEGQVIPVHTFKLPFRTDDPEFLSQIHKSLEDEIFFSDGAKEKIQTVVDDFCAKMECSSLEVTAS